MGALASFLAASCSTADPTEFGGFGRTAAVLQTETGTAFADANRVSRSVETDRFVRSGAIALTERQFPPAVPPAVAERWRAALSDLVIRRPARHTADDAIAGIVARDLSTMR